MQEEKTRKLTIKAFHIHKAGITDKTFIENGELGICNSQIYKAAKNSNLISSLTVNIIEPTNRNIYVDTIMDFIPISCKVLGKTGEGITHTLTGIYAMICARDESGRQMAAFGSSQGILQDQVKWGKPGTPDREDIILHLSIVLKKELPFTRELPNAIMEISEVLLQEIRHSLKELDGRTCDELNEYFDIKKKGHKKVALIKLVAGQGACYDNRLFSNEPSGFHGGKSIIDIGNIPILLTPNEYRDGALRALT